MLKVNIIKEIVWNFRTVIVNAYFVQKHIRTISNTAYFNIMCLNAYILCKMRISDVIVS